MKDKVIEKKMLKAILWIYIIFCLLIAGVKYGMGDSMSNKMSEFVNWFWHFYENWIKMFVIIMASFLTLSIVGKSQRTVMRKKNLIGFMTTALAVHIILPIVTQNKELYLFTMPLPWTSVPLQLANTSSSYHAEKILTIGMGGISAALVFYISFSILVFAGTLLFGRRLQCSTLCLFNGFAAEVFAPAIPLVEKEGKGKKEKKMKAGTLKFFTVLRWIFLAIALFFMIWWLLFLAGVGLESGNALVEKLETVKYLCFELMMAMFFWVAYRGRAYCYYCPLGTILALLGRAAGQEIGTNQAKCVQCGKCNKACPMSIEIKEKAKKGEAVRNLRCVGCGHCVDACPSKTLYYSTGFLKRRSKRRSRK